MVGAEEGEEAMTVAATIRGQRGKCSAQPGDGGETQEDMNRTRDSLLQSGRMVLEKEEEDMFS